MAWWDLNDPQMAKDQKAYWSFHPWLSERGVNPMNAYFTQQDYFEEEW